MGDFDEIGYTPDPDWHAANDHEHIVNRKLGTQKVIHQQEAQELKRNIAHLNEIDIVMHEIAHDEYIHDSFVIESRVHADPTTGKSRTDDTFESTIFGR